MAYDALNAGDLTRQVTIQSRAATDDGGGGQTITWTNGATVWAAISPGAGREFVAAQQLTPELSHIVKIRYRAGVTAKQRLTYVVKIRYRAGVTAKQRLTYVVDGVTRVFPIHAVADPMERREQLVLYCSEVSPT